MGRNMTLRFVSSFCAGDRHVQRDSGALSRLARNLHVTTMKQHNALNDRQSQASASRTLGTRRVNTEEAIKNLRQGFGWDADACVGNFYANRGKIGDRPQHDCSAGWRVSQSI